MATRVSLIATVLNDRLGTQTFLNSMELQVRIPDQIIVCDAGSTDGTWELLARYEKFGRIPLKALSEPGCSCARGRNIAADAAICDILAVTDIGCQWDKEWFQELIQPFESQPEAQVVLGSWMVRWEDQRTEWARADYVLQNGLTLCAGPDSHSANRSIAFQKDFYFTLGGQPEDLTLAAEDMVFALLIERIAKVKSAAPVPRCYWERPQALRSLLSEAKRNAIGDGEADIHRKHFVLTTGRIGIEILSITAFLGTCLEGRVVFAATAASAYVFLSSLRIFGLRKRQRAFERRGQLASLSYMLILDYSRKLWWGAGYIRGWLRGRRQCTSTRRKLRVCGVASW